MPLKDIPFQVHYWHLKMCQPFVACCIDNYSQEIGDISKLLASLADLPDDPPATPGNVLLKMPFQIGAELSDRNMN